MPLNVLVLVVLDPPATQLADPVRNVVQVGDPVRNVGDPVRNVVQQPVPVRKLNVIRTRVAGPPQRPTGRLSR